MLALVRAAEGKGTGPTRDGEHAEEGRESPFEAVFVTRRSWRRQVCPLSCVSVVFCSGRGLGQLWREGRVAH